MEWFYALADKQCGPVTEAQLDELLASRKITLDTLVWHPGMADWQPLHTQRPAAATTGQPALVVPAIIAADQSPCAECRRVFPQADMLFLNKSWVCAACKPLFLQRLAEGAAPPEAAGGLWRQAKLLVTRSETPMPDRCVKCNAPANGYRLKRQLYWHHPAIYLVAVFGLLMCLGLLIYIIVALIVRKRAVLHIGLCQAHRTQRLWAIAGSWLAALVGVGAVFAGIGGENWVVMMLGFGAILAALIVGAVRGPVVAASYIDKDVVKLRGAGTKFLAELPEWPG